jgi:ppGpp synthetase/RelA/SpoT-type nucleotidyltranferase
MADSSEERSEFDFDAHSQSAVAEYVKIHPLYEEFAQTAKEMISIILRGAHVRYQSIEARSKEIDEFGKKAAKPLESDPSKPKYPNPLNDITDMAGVRVITFLPRTVEDVCRLIEQNFEVLEKIDKAEKLVDQGKIGYQSIHYLVKMHSSRAKLPEYKSYKDLILEIQVRTILQHAWAEMEHDIQYKSTEKIPTLIKRRFIALAGLLDIADREFQMLDDQYEQKKQQQENELRTYINDLARSPDEDYIVESLKEMRLWIGSEEFKEVLSKELAELEEKRKDLEKSLRNLGFEAQEK